MKKRSKRFCLLFAAAVIGLSLAGCGAEKEPQVIGEKQENTQESTADPGAAKESTVGSEKSDGGGVREQVQAPERWKAEVKEEEMIVLADAPVTVPDVGQLGVKKAETANFTKAEYERVKDVLSKELKLSWVPGSSGSEEDRAGWETIAEDGGGTNGTDYRISYRTALEYNAPGSSLIWVTRRIGEGRSSTQQDIVYDTAHEEAVSRSAKAEEFEKKAEELLNAAGFENYRQYRGMWRKHFYRTMGEDQAEMEYQIVFTPVVDGVGCAQNVVNLFGNSYLYGPYIEVFYMEDGTLNQLKIIDKEIANESAETEHFLLPFEAVHELFVQYCRDFFYKGSETAGDAGATTVIMPSLDTDSRPVVTVKYVRLEYVFMQEKGHQPVNELELIPAWNFYGSIKNGHVSPEDGTVQTEDYWTARKEPEGLILSIRADDGQILVD